MSVISQSELQRIIPIAAEEHINTYLPALNEVLPKFGIDTPLRVCHFIAQIAHESGGLKYESENLNYSATALRAVFGKYFKDEAVAQEYHRQPERIANVVYADRMGNGPSDTCDGWNYRGRGLIQLTGKDNYRICGEAIGIDLVEQPEVVAEQPAISVSAACWYWNSRHLNQLADQDNIVAITRKINGGTHGLENRKAYLHRAKQAFNIASSQE